MWAVISLGSISGERVDGKWVTRGDSDSLQRDRIKLGSEMDIMGHLLDIYRDICGCCHALTATIGNR